MNFFWTLNSFSILLLAVKVGDDYLVNGRWSIALKKDIKAAGTLIKYRLGKGPGSTEVITAAGPTSKEIQIVVSNNCIYQFFLVHHALKLATSMLEQSKNLII